MAERVRFLRTAPVPRRPAKAEPPDSIAPQLAQLVDDALEGDDWLHEIKIDGYRIGARIDLGKVQMFTRRGNDWTARFRPIAGVLAGLPVKSAYLDGEIAILTAEGVSDFGALQEALGKHGGSRGMACIVFDILHLDGRDLRSLPLVERKATLEKLLAKQPARSPVQYSSHIVGQGAEFFALACKRHLEGIISKRVDAPYRAGRSGEWLKTKCTYRQEFVIGGYCLETSGRPNLGSLLIGYYDNGKLVYAGSVGTGWSIQLGRSIMAKLRRIGRDASPFVAVPRPDAKDARWSEPKLVCEVQFTTWTGDGRVRHPSFKGMREDKPAKSVKRELPKA
jgi:bifunctional non-homologous end joining protein LigD